MKMLLQVWSFCWVAFYGEPKQKL